MPDFSMTAGPQEQKWVAAHAAFDATHRQVDKHGFRQLVHLSRTDFQDEPTLADALRVADRMEQR